MSLLAVLLLIALGCTLAASFLAIAVPSLVDRAFATGTLLSTIAVGCLGFLPAPPSLMLPFAVHTPLSFGLAPFTGGAIVLTEVALGLTAYFGSARAGRQGFWLPFAWLTLATCLFFMAHTALAFVLSWSMLTAAAYGLVVGEGGGRALWRASWVMVSLTEFGSAFLLLAALLVTAGPASPLPSAVAAALGLIGLGSKAGLFPFQIWLPVAEPEAKGHVAGMLSGILTAVALVGMWRWCAMTSPPAWIGWALVLFGVAGALLSAIHAVVERDVKRVLAYSTAEWIGLALVALGMSLALNTPRAAVALFEDAFFLIALTHLGAKTAAFVATDWIETHLGTRDLNHLGGLYRACPRLARPLLLAVSALMAIPPSGGYLAEWMLLEGVFMAAGTHTAVIWLPLPLALIMALGATALLRWYGVAFLGPLRRQPTGGGRSPHSTVLWFGGILAWASGVGSPWILTLFSRYLPPLLTKPPLNPIAPTFIEPARTTALNALGGGIFRGLPGVPGVIIFPGQGFTATSPWDLLWFGTVLVGLVALVRFRLLARRSAPRLVTPWTGGRPYYALFAWTAEGIPHPLRLAFAPVLRLERRRQVQEGTTFVEVDTVDRLFHEGFRPLMAVLLRLARRVRDLHSGELRHSLGVLFWVTVLGVVLLRWLSR